MRRHAGRVGILALWAGAALGSTAHAAAEDYGPDLDTYRALIERYRSGDVGVPVSVAGSWGPFWIESTVGRLLDACKSAPRGETAGLVQAAQGAFLLHTHAALALHALGLSSTDRDAHVEAARQLLRWFRDRYREGSWPAEARGLRPRDFYLALASAELLMASPVTARKLAEESLRSEGDDPAMRLLAGCALETEAYSRRLSEGRWPDKLLRDAEHRFVQVLDDAPTLLEAQLRLGWVLVRRGKAESARPFLEAVAERPGYPGRRALAWLFLGRVHEERRDSPAAIKAYRRAIEIAPHFQAPHIALAHVLEEGTGDEAAREILLPFFLERSRSWVREDPWNEYPFGPPEMWAGPFEALRERLCGR